MSQKLFGLGDNEFEASDTNFDLFSKPTLNNDFYTYNDFTFKPKHPIQNSEHNPIVFEIEDSRNYSILPSIRIDGKLKVTHADGSDLTEDEKVSPCNLFPHALFQTIDIKVNNQPISDHARLYPHRAFVHCLFSYSEEVKKNTQICEYFLDDITKDEKVDDTSSAFTQKMDLIKKSRICYFSFEPKIDTMTITRFFPPGHSIAFEFIRAPSHFTLLGSDESKKYKIEIVDMSLTCRQLLPTESIESRMKKLMLTKDIHLPVTRLVSRTRSLHAGLFDGTIYNAISGKMPSHIMMLFLKNSQITSDLSCNPFHFGRYDLEEANLVINGQSYPSEALTFNETVGDYFKAFKFFLSNIGCTGDMSIGIGPNRYVKDSFCLAFDLTPDICLNNHMHFFEDSVNIDIKLRFKKALAHPLTVLYISTYDNCVTISPDKSVTLDYTV